MAISNTVFPPNATPMNNKPLLQLAQEWPKSLYARGGVTPGGGYACVAAEWFLNNISLANTQLLLRYQAHFVGTPLLDTLWVSLWADIIINTQQRAFDDAIQRGELGPDARLGGLYRAAARYAVAITLVELMAAERLPLVS